MKVYAFRIPKKPGENIMVQHDKLPVFYDKLHQHEEIQISLIVNGMGKLIVGDGIHSFEKGDIFVIGSDLPHLFQNSPSDLDAEMISLFFTRNSFGKDFFDLPEMTELKDFFAYSASGFKVCSNHVSLSSDIEAMRNVYGFAKFMTFLNLIKKLNQYKKERLSSFVSAKELSNEHGERLRAVFDYVMTNFHQKIALEQVSHLVFMTPNAFCRFFKQRTRKTFFRFLIEVRVEHAYQLLLQPNELSISEIASLSGFSSISNFNKQFKEIKGKSPSTFVKALG